MNNKNLKYSSNLHVLIPLSPFSCRQKKGVRSFLAPLCKSERACPDRSVGGWDGGSCFKGK